jgi:hypothetical protein
MSLSKGTEAPARGRGKDILANGVALRIKHHDEAVALKGKVPVSGAVVRCAAEISETR